MDAVGLLVEQADKERLIEMFGGEVQCLGVHPAHLKLAAVAERPVEMGPWVPGAGASLAIAQSVSIPDAQTSTSTRTGR